MAARVTRIVPKRVWIVVCASFFLEAAALLLFFITPIDVGYPPGTSRVLVYASGATVLLHYPALRLLDSQPSAVVGILTLFVQGWAALSAAILASLLPCWRLKLRGR